MRCVESPQTKRLRLIDFYLCFFGKVNRSDLIQHGDIAVATASRSFNAYKERFPNNTVFNESLRAYMRSASFSPAFEHDPEAALRLIAWGQELNSIPVTTYGVSSFATVLDSLSIDIVSQVTRSILNKHCISVLYSSSTSTETRTLTPHSLFKGLGAWHIRAWDSKRRKFLCFRISRILKAQQTESSYDKTIKDDTLWNRDVVLSVAPHSKHENRNDLAIDLGMEGQYVRNITTNEALAGYVLNDLHVDCTPNASLPPHAFNLQLMNRHELEHVDSIRALVPGLIQNKDDKA